jgi:inner membrane transporter RhtA
LTHGLKQLLLAVLAAILAMASVSIGAAVAKSLFPAIGTDAMAGLRNGFASVILIAWWRPWRGGRLNRRQILLLAIYGVNLGLMNLLYYRALNRLPLGLAVAIEFTGPFGLALANSRRWSDLLWLALAVIGLLLLLPWGAPNQAVDPRGVILALSAGATWALYIMLAQNAGKTMGSGRVTALGTGIAALISLPVVMQAPPAWSAFSATTLPLALVVALFSSAIPYTLDMVALKRLPTRTFGILMSLDPAAAALAGFVMLGEQLTFRQVVAILCVMIASVGSTASARRGTLVPSEPVC